MGCTGSINKKALDAQGPNTLLASGSVQDKIETKPKVGGGLSDLLGTELLGKEATVSTKEALAGKRAVALYFSAHWCPPCRAFTPQLGSWYTTDLREKGLEVVFVSSDRDNESFNQYFAEMPWKALPFEDRERKEMLNKKFNVSGIPCVVILDMEGNIITKDGRSVISADPTGEGFLPKTKPNLVKDMLAAAKLINNEGVADSSLLDGRVLGLYFSAHWCPPCRNFTPKLAEFYKKDLKQKGLEIIFVSSDQDEAAFNEYFKEQPWLALDYSCREEKQQLSDLFHVKGIPSLVIVDKDGSTITTDGRGNVMRDPTGAQFPWKS